MHEHLETGFFLVAALLIGLLGYDDAHYRQLASATARATTPTSATTMTSGNADTCVGRTCFGNLSTGSNDTCIGESCGSGVPAAASLTSISNGSLTSRGVTLAYDDTYERTWAYYYDREVDMFDDATKSGLLIPGGVKTVTADEGGIAEELDGNFSAIDWKHPKGYLLIGCDHGFVALMEDQAASPKVVVSWNAKKHCLDLKPL